MSVAPNRRTVLRGAAFSAAAAATASLAGGFAAGPAFAAPAAGPAAGLGPNVLVFDPSMGDAAIQAKVDAVFATQQSNQFGSERYALAFLPGTYHVDVNVGFYTHVLGLGESPDDVVINGHVTVDAQWLDGNGTQDFWRCAENLCIVPPDGLERWAVAQAGPMRRAHIKGDMTLWPSPPGNRWSSGGFLADSVVDGQVDSGSQQQWLSRNDTFGSWTGSNWNMVFVGVEGAPAQSFPSPPYTTVDRTPVVREKPFLTTDGKGGYRVFVPAVRRDSTGTTWGSGRPAAGRSLPLSLFHVARPGDSAASINEALALGRHLLLTPGVYPLSSPLRVNRPGTVVLGLGLATLRATRGNALIEVADVGGVSVAGVLLEAGSAGSPALLRVGRGRSAVRHDLDPTVLFDVYARIGGAVAGGAAVSVQIDSNDVICDNLWLWRADHGEDGTVGWAVNPADTGFLVNGDRVTAYGLAVEHYQKYEVLWNGNHGRTYFFQNEHPYDVPTQAAWVHGGTNGYAAYKVGDHVTDHQAWGLGSYCYFDLNANIYTDRAYEVPDTPGVVFTDLMIVCLNGAGGGGILHCVNDAGGPVENGFGTYFMKRYSNGAGA
ncbi:adenylyl cyclase [Phaeacidiphilus oryzae]|uniref:adenylyl cyclase n=1 Tax=Phaeacidiphilus oryzae TaxID=348818 RepID=UPI000B0E8E40|nr:adenylyl cyclase [Phaeacidiphilus oryzae]